MTLLKNSGQPRGAWAFVQAGRVPARITRTAAVVSLACASGCSNYHTSGPEAWYHENVGGAISSQRPPPPGLNDPYPNLATVPAKPAPADAAAWNRVTAGLITDRINAREAAALAPIPGPASGAPAGPPPGRGQPQAVEPGASAAFVGASPPPAAQPAPSAKKKAAGSQAAPPLAEPPPGADRAVAPVSSAATAQRVAAGQLPPLPTAAPPRPNIAPAPPRPLVPITAALPPVTPPDEGATGVDFAHGSASLTDAALAEVKTLAAIRADHGIAITGYGDAVASDAVGQSDAVGLGLSRAQALATALVAQGVPYARLRLNAESAGRGASLRLLQ